jgi:hypothetical protein
MHTSHRYISHRRVCNHGCTLWLRILPFLVACVDFVSQPLTLVFHQASTQFKGSLKGRGGITWFASDKPSTSVFLPLLVAPLPIAFSIGQPSVMDKKAAYWLFRFVLA